MCGLVFAYAKAPGGLPDQATLDRMDTAIRHRGPDEHGQHRLEQVAMGHRRLAIIDLTGGQQPMASPDGKVWIVFNGEIYNFEAVAADLRSAGVALRGRSDTEVLLHAYLTWGEACLDRLNGMFAFVIYDGRDGSIFAARDRYGEKPLYIAGAGKGFVFASDIRAVLALTPQRRALDRRVVKEFL